MIEQAKGYGAKLTASIAIAQTMGNLNTWILQPTATAFVHKLTETIPQQTVVDATAIGLIAATVIGSLAEGYYLRKTDGISYNPWSSFLYPRLGHNPALTIAASTALGYGQAFISNPTDIVAIGSLLTPDKSLFVSDMAGRTITGFALCMLGTAFVATGNAEKVADKIQQTSDKVRRKFPVIDRVRKVFESRDTIPDYPDAIPDGTVTLSQARDKILASYLPRSM